MVDNIVITHDSDPDLWDKLYGTYLEGKTQEVLDGTQMYHVINLVTQDVGFLVIDSIDYIDSRSLIKSRSASYNELSQNN